MTQPESIFHATGRGTLDGLNRVLKARDALHAHQILQSQGIERHTYRLRYVGRASTPEEETTVLPTKLYRFTHLDHPHRIYDVWATGLDDARRMLKSQHGRSHCYYRHEIIEQGNPEPINPDNALLTEITRYLQNTTSRAQYERATTILGMVKNSTATPFPDKPSQLTEASAFLGKNVLVHRPGINPPIWAGTVVGVRQELGGRTVLSIREFGTPSSSSVKKDFNYGQSDTFTEIDKNN